MNPEQLRDLGFQLEGRAPRGESGGAWFAIAADGARVVLKWFADEGAADRYAVLLPAIDVLRSRGVPVRHSQKSSEYNKGQFHRRLRHQIHSRIYARVLG